MINFFRKIRKELAAENDTKKYLRYAIGEILLVVIGILIALQINDWNDVRKAKIVEKELLQQFISDLQGDLKNLDELILINKLTVESCDILVNHLKNKLPYHDSLSKHFDNCVEMTPLMFNKSAYTSLTTKGPEFISDKNLRNEILRLYSTTFENTISFNNYFREDYHSFIAPIQLENIEPIELGKESIPVDYEVLKGNRLYINALQFSKNAHRVNNIEFVKTRNEVKKMIKLIKLEIK